MRIGFIHATCNAVAPIMETAKAFCPEVNIVNFVDEYLLEHANQVGGIDPAGLRQFAKLLFSAAQANPDGIVVACTVYSPMAAYFQPFLEVPIVGIDRAMIEQAVDSGEKIGIIGTTAPSVPAMKKQMLEYAVSAGKVPVMETRTVTEAMARLRAGDPKAHDDLIRRAALELIAAGCTTIVLSQITMARARQQIQIPGITVLTSPETGLARILERIKQGRPNENILM